MRIHNLSIVFFTLIFIFSKFASKAEVDNSEKKESNWSKKLKEKKLKNLRNKLDSTNTSYPQPFLTIHLGASYSTNTGNVQLNSGQISGTIINVPKDLGFPNIKIFPRVNAIVNFGNFHGAAFDTYSVLRKEEDVLNKDIRYGDKTFSSGSSIKSRLSLNYVSLSYINFFHNNGRSRLAYLAGVTGIYYKLKITSTSLADFSQKEDVFILLPTIGLNGSIYLRKNLLFRAVVKYSGWWFQHYNCNIIDFNPYFEYYIHKNFGVGMRYNYGYTNLKNLPDKKFNGSVKNTFSAISVVLVCRFIKKS